MSRCQLGQRIGDLRGVAPGSELICVAIPRHGPPTGSQFFRYLSSNAPAANARIDIDGSGTT